MSGKDKKAQPSLFWAPIVAKSEDRVEKMMSDMRDMIAEFGVKNTQERKGSMLLDKQGRPARRAQIHGETALEDDADEEMVIKLVPKTNETRFHILDILKQHFLFCRMSDQELEFVIDAMAERFCEPGEVVIEQGEESAKHFFVMISGVCEVEVNGNRVAYMTKKCAFGELALMYNTPRAATIRARGMCEMWTIERDFFRKALISSSRVLLKKMRSFLAHIPLFRDSNYTEETLTLLARSLFKVQHSDEDYIIKQGDTGEEFFVLYEGTVRITKLTDEGTEVELIKLHKGDVFGERALLRDDVRAANVISHGPTTCFVLRRAEFNTMLGDLRGRMTVLNHHRIWRSAQIFKNLNDNALTTLEARSVKTLKLNVGQELKGDLGADSLYLVLDGTVESSVLETFETGSVIGSVNSGMSFVGDLLKCMTEEATLVQINRHDITELTEAGDSEDQVAPLDDEAIIRSLGSSVDTNDEFAFGRMSLDVSLSNSSSLQSSPVSRASPRGRALRRQSVVRGKKGASVYGFDQAELGGIFEDDDGPTDATADHTFDIHRHEFQGKIGAGSFATIYVISGEDEDAKDGENDDVVLYALKVVDKQKLSPGMKSYSNREVSALKELSGFYFISNFLGVLENERFVCLRLELLPGGDLFGYMYGASSRTREKGPCGGLSLKSATAFAANIVVMLQFIHDRGYAYRDLKPENLLFDLDGYLILSDFGLSKKIPFKDSLGKDHRRTYTLCGTPDYMAPEIVLTQGHDKSVDLWAFGILLYELLCGIPPFSDSNKQKVFERIVRADKYLVLPNTMDSHAKSLVRGLLHPNPVLRTGTLRTGLQAVREMPLFTVHGTDWDALEHCRSATPYKPPNPTAVTQRMAMFPDPPASEVENILAGF